MEPGVTVPVTRPSFPIILWSATLPGASLRHCHRSAERAQSPAKHYPRCAGCDGAASAFARTLRGGARHRSHRSTMDEEVERGHSADMLFLTEYKLRGGMDRSD